MFSEGPSEGAMASLWGQPLLTRGLGGCRELPGGSARDSAAAGGLWGALRTRGHPGRRAPGSVVGSPLVGEGVHAWGV